MFLSVDIWKNLNASDANVRKAAEDKWSQQMTAYTCYLKEIQTSYAGSAFWEKYYNNQWFHDFLITEITFFSDVKKEKCVVITIRNGKTCYALEFRGICQCIIDVEDLTSAIQGNLTWGFAELSMGQNRQIKILCDFSNTILLTFKKLSIRSVN